MEHPAIFKNWLFALTCFLSAQSRGDSEIQPQRELHQTWASRNRSDASEVGAVDVRHRVVEIHGVEEVEDLGAEFKVCAFREPCALQRAEIEVPVTRPEDRGQSQRTRRARFRVEEYDFRRVVARARRKVGVEIKHAARRRPDTRQIP